MPRQDIILQVFVASPSDVTEERAALEEVVRELNATWSRTLRCTLELIQWETHAVPGIGDDPQEVINRTVPQDYEVFIGLLWSRFGTPTNRAGSGTEEEFERAYKRYEDAPDSIEVMFYFKDEPVSPSHIDPEQLRKVQAFRKRIGDLGALSPSFNTVDDFQNLVRVHLSRLVQKWAARSLEPAGTAPPQSSLPAVEVPEAREQENEDEGFLDLVEQANDALTKLKELAERMTMAVGELGAKMTTRAAEINDLRPDRGSYDIKAAKRIAGRAGADLDEYVARTEVDIPVFAEALSTAMSSFGRAVSISTEFGIENTSDLEQARVSTKSLRTTLIESKASLQRLRDSLAGTPRIASVYNKSKRKALATMDSLLREFEVGASHVSELEGALDEIIGRSSPSE